MVWFSPKKYWYNVGEKDNSLPGWISAHRLGGPDNCELYLRKLLWLDALVTSKNIGLFLVMLVAQTSAFSRLLLQFFESFFSLEKSVLLPLVF